MTNSKTVVVSDLDHTAMIRCVQRHRLNGYQWVTAVKDMVTGLYRVEARPLPVA